MDIQMKAEVWAQDGRFGRVSGVLINPNNNHLTHIVVSQGDKKSEEYLVPINMIGQASGPRVTLNCQKDELDLMTMIPADQVLLRSEARVKAKDGFVGHIHKLKATPRTGNISSIGIDKGGLFKRHQYVTIPDTSLGRIEPNLIHVKMDKHDFSILTPTH